MDNTETSCSESGDVMTVTVKKITWDELIDHIQEQSARIHETDAEERRLTDPAMILMDIRECAGCEPYSIDAEKAFDWLKTHGLIEQLNCGCYVCTDKGAALADQLIRKEAMK